MSSLIYNGLELSNNSVFKNLNIECLDIDPTTLQLGRIWYLKSEKHFKYVTLNNHNLLTINSFSNLEDIDTKITNSSINCKKVFLRDSDNNGDVQFAIPDDSNLEDAINLIAAEISKIKNYLNNGLTSVSEYYLTQTTNIITLDYTVSLSRLLILINGLEQPIAAYSLGSNSKSIIFTELIPVTSYIKVISFNLI